MDIISRPTTHSEDRKNSAIISFLILHYTETLTAQEAEDYFLGTRIHPTGSRVSVHYMVDENGIVTQYVDESNRAWHAGISYWEGITDINSHSIGIEIVNPGHAYGYRAFPAAQMNPVAQLCKDILGRHKIPPHRVLAHSDIAPGRKRDPGELFPWQQLAAQGIGLWPDEKQGDPDGDITALLRAYGYDPNVPSEQAITAFQRHFQTETFDTPEKAGQADETTLRRLSSLLHLKNLSFS